MSRSYQLMISLTVFLAIAFLYLVVNSDGEPVGGLICIICLHTDTKCTPRGGCVGHGEEDELVCLNKETRFEGKLESPEYHRTEYFRNCVERRNRTMGCSPPETSVDMNNRTVTTFRCWCDWDKCNAGEASNGNPPKPNNNDPVIPSDP